MIGKTISHYKVLEKLGEGGMGVVYKAEDTRLKRPVALKFLKHEAVGDSLEKKRFLHEAQAAARLDHPNICSVYEVDHIVGQSFIAMAYIDGQSMKDRLEGGQLELDDVLDFARQIAEGLNEAHEKGIVHRDIKPGNIMLTTKGQVKIMDFGLAKLSDMTRVTKTGSTIGTMAYMSPEQARGEEVGRSTDIWSFGVVLYEMLTGQLPFQGEYEAAVLYSILNRELESVSSLRPDTPRNLQRIIGKALEKEPADRYQCMAEIIADLKETKPTDEEEPEPKKSIIVLPFVNMSPDPDQEYFSDGLTEEIITDLSHVGDLLVISRNSAMTFKGTKKKTREIARDVSARYVLEGSVRKAGNNLRITAQLIDATTDAHLWAEKYRGTLDDVFEIQEEVSQAIVDALKLKLKPEENRKIAERPIKDVQAYECYQRARQEIWRCTEHSFEHAIQLLNNGIEIVGENDLLLATMGTVYFQYINLGIAADESFLKKAEEYAGRVFEIDPESPPGHRLRGLIHWKRGNVQEGVKELNRALAQDPNNPDNLMLLAYLYGFSGKGFAAKQLLKKLLEIDPLTPVNHLIAGNVHLLEGQFEAALGCFETMFRMEPKEPVFRFSYGNALAWNSQFEKAYAIFDLIVNDTPQNFFAGLVSFLKFALQGDKQEALKMVTDELVERAKWDELFTWEMAVCYALIEEKEEALDWLELSVNRGWIPYPFLNEYDPFLENIRGEPRFKKLMERVKYEWEHFEV